MKHDAIVIGVGTAGAAAAQSLARNGLSVLALDRRPIDQAGAHWVNGVPAWAFAQAQIDPPCPPELRGGDHAFHIVAGWGPTRVIVDRPPVLEVDMRHLVVRLQDLAREHGATLQGSTRVTHVARREGGLEVHTDRGAHHTRFLVDASGLEGHTLLAHLGPPRPKPAPADLCVAAQGVFQITDPQAARSFFQKHETPVGDVLCFTGIEGGYSIVNLRMGEEDGPPSLSILTGSIPGAGHPSGTILLDRFVAEHPWVGTRIFGGARAIPLAPPHAQLGNDRVALIGDAANQVFAMHGSGIGAQLVAGALLGKTLGEGGTPWDYSVAWHRTWGGLFSSSECFARWSRGLSSADTQRLIHAGLMTPNMARQGLAQEVPRPDPADILRIAAGIPKALGIARRLAPILVRMQRLQWHARRYPDTPAGLPRWQQTRPGG